MEEARKLAALFDDLERAAMADALRMAEEIRRALGPSPWERATYTGTPGATPNPFLRMFEEAEAEARCAKMRDIEARPSTPPSSPG